MLLANAFNNNLQPLTTLYNFSDGYYENIRYASLTTIDNDGFLYGISSTGGNTLSICTYGCGTIFKINPTTGELTTLYKFSGYDGFYPEASLIMVNDGFLYGTTVYGGNNQCDGSGCGTIFKFNLTTGELTTLYNFRGIDGAMPYSSLLTINDDAFLYGTTSEGGNGCISSGCGTIFKLNLKTKVLTTLHNFSGTDGAFIYSSLTTVANDGFLYGTVFNGGGNCFNHVGCGSIFKLNLKTKVLTTLYTFSGTDGAYPYASLTTMGSDGFLYGSTSRGGNNSSNGGTIFKINPSTGKLTTLYSFSGTDGAYPYASLSTMGNDGFLYGTTGYGGNINNVCYRDQTCGTMFKLNPTTGELTTLYKFSWSDGSNPFASLTSIGNDGFLYGITSGGGDSGFGTIFKINTNNMHN